MQRSAYTGLIALALLSSLSARQAAASPADYVYTPNVEYGEKELDFKYGNAKQPDGTRQQAASLGFGYGASEHWFTEVYLKYEHLGSEATKLDAFEWENRFQLGEQGEYPVDMGLLAEIEIPNASGAPKEFKIGALFQKDIDKIQLNGNLLFERKFGGTRDPEGEPYVTEFGYQWQAKYRWHTALEFGLQGFGETGEWNHWDKSGMQKHSMGPAIFGKLAVGHHHFVKYNAAWLSGTTANTPDHTLRTQVEYEF